ncbi:MAG: GWxTD domain-containing protein [candidate division KSB1 bacterium]|nr:GWxTD domain-containing protein [candidate division KSB1 bacterium]MDZ7318153.1 GWxTD domain-containing protein [candidate division KSB1 bacterium]MDZ7342394.1 GWxTD domain-containing protein [candidate division KSB1 bacterium]
MKKILIVGLIVMSTMATNLVAQDEPSLLPFFDYEIVCFPGTVTGSSKAQVYVWVRNSYLQFVAIDSGYSARYQLNVGINRGQRTSFLTNDQTHPIFEKTYAATIDPKIQRVHYFEFQLPPAEYQFQIRLLDLNTNRSRQQQRMKTIRSFEGSPLALSDVIILASCDGDSLNRDRVIPSMNIPIQDKIYIYSEVVNENIGFASEIQAIIIGKERRESYKSSQQVALTNRLSRICLEIPKENMSRGENQLILTVNSKGLSRSVQKDLRFVLGAAGFSGSVTDELIEPLMYITDAEDWKKIQSARGAQREEVLKEFWDKRDPSPGSPENELYDEFYKRVEYVNRQFSVQRTLGWRTPRGQVFIIFGPPDRVERSNPYTYSQAIYEVWYYDDIREKFVFLDEYGFGDFKLVSGNLRPVY